MNKQLTATKKNLENEKENGLTVHFAESDVVAIWRDNFESILELAESNGLELPFQCRMGTCSTCESELISGEVTYNPEPFVDIEEGWILTCCSQPKTDIKIAQ